MEFTFTTPTRIVVGWGAATDKRLVDEAARLGKRPLVVAGKSLRASGALDTILGNLKSAGLEPTIHENVPPEPDITDLEACVRAAEQANADCVLAIGGGSVLDVAKGAAGLAYQGHAIRHYFDGSAAVPETGGLSFLAAPTTAGTGSEVTWVGVFTDKATRRKTSIRGGAMMPAVALLDAQLTVSCPPSVTANSGMDAFVQAVEAYTSSGANPLTDALACDATVLVVQGLEQIWDARQQNVSQDTARAGYESVALGSLMAGMALNTSRLGLVHGLAHPIGARTGAAHGLICGLLMPAVMRFNRVEAEGKYADLARTLGIVARGVGKDEQAVNAFIGYVENLLNKYGIPRRLSQIGLTDADLDVVAQEAMSSGSTKANPRLVTPDDAHAVAAFCL